jgi:hypothetical protein
MPASDRLSTFIAAGAWAAIVGGAALVMVERLRGLSELSR